MPIAITIPRLGWNMDEGVFAGWLKGDGETVRAGEPLFSLEGEKATQDVEAIDGGILSIPPGAPGAGDTVAVGAVIAYLLGPGEGGEQREDDRGKMTDDRPNRTGDRGQKADGEVRPAERAVTPNRNPVPGGRTRSSPLARRLARELGVDWTGLRGSGRTGRVRKADVLAAAAGARQTVGEVPLTAARRATAARMVESRNTTAPVTLTTTVDATNLVGLRRQFQATGGSEVPGVTDVLVKLVALALNDHPRLHARWAGDRLVVPAEANVGVAVDTEAGLLVPVIRGAAGLGLRQVAARSRELTGRAREGRLRAGDTEGGTFTVTSLGALGVETFTPIINPPECAVLGVGRIARVPVMEGDRVVGRERMALSLTFDHRVVDGAPAARFLQALARMIENPGPWLVA